MMKSLKTRALALAGALAFVGAGAVFGQGNAAEEGVPPGPDTAAKADPGLDVAGGKLKIGVYVNSGFEADMSKTKTKVGDNEQPEQEFKELYGYAQDADNSGRAQVDLRWTSGDATFGTNVRLRADNWFERDLNGDGAKSGSNSKIPLFRYGYGWWKPFKYLGVSGGLVDDTVFRTDGDKNDDALDFAAGALPGGLLHITPVDILDIGFGAFAGRPKGVDDAEFDEDIDDDVAYLIGAVLKTKPVTVKASLLLNDGFNNALFSIGTSAVNNLTLALEGQVFNARKYSNKKLDDDKFGFWGDIKAGYDGIANGLVDLSLVVYFYANDWKEGVDSYYAKDTTHRAYGAAPKYLTINPKVYFNLLGGKIKPGLHFEVDLAKADDFYVGTIPVKDLSGYEIQLRPFVNFPVGAGYVEFAYQFKYSSGSGTMNMGQGDQDVKMDTTTNTIYLDFLFKY